MHLYPGQEYPYEKIYMGIFIKLGKKVIGMIAEWQSSLIWNIFFHFWKRKKKVITCAALVGNKSGV